MPAALMRVCAAPSCPNLVKSGRCDSCQKQKQSAYDERRGNAASRGYGSDWTRWRDGVISGYRLRLCGDRPSRAPMTADSRCKAEGRIVSGEELDHIEPMTSKDDPRRKDVTNVQYLCAECHARKRQRESQTHRRSW
jgi:5-methylcytosine-specific restriction protein A